MVRTRTLMARGMLTMAALLVAPETAIAGACAG